MVVQEVITSWRRVASTHDLQGLLLQGPVPYSTQPQGPAAATLSWPVNTRLLGIVLVLGGCLSFLVTGSVVVLKLLPPVEHRLTRMVQEDWYYCLLIPCLLPVTLAAVAVNWFCLKLFKHNS